MIGPFYSMLYGAVKNIFNEWNTSCGCIIPALVSNCSMSQLFSTQSLDFFYSTTETISRIFAQWLADSLEHKYTKINTDSHQSESVHSLWKHWWGLTATLFPSCCLALIIFTAASLRESIAGPALVYLRKMRWATPSKLGKVTASKWMTTIHI